MANKVVIKRTSVAGRQPNATDIDVGELAVNLADKKLFTKDGSGTVIQLGGGSGSGDVVGPDSATDNAIARFDGTTGKLIQNSAVTLDDNGTLANVNSVGFDTTPAVIPTAEGSMYWDADKGSLAYVMQGEDVVQEIGESQFLYIQASANITKGQVVMFTGAVGGSGIPTGAPATGVTDGTYIMGVAAEDITSGTSGFVQNFGILKPINTTSFSTGSILWYDPSVTGGLTTTKPVAPNIKVQIAAVTAGNSSGGAIFIRITSGTELGGTDSNVLFGSLVGGNLIAYDQTAGHWKNITLTDGTGISVTETSSGEITITNTAPDQTVSISGGGTTTIGGTYPNFTVTSADQFQGTVTSVSGTGTASGLSLSGTVTTSGSLTLSGTVNSLAAGTYGISISGNAATANSATSSGSINVSGGWSVTPSGTNLFFAYNGVNKGKLDSSGNFTVVGNVTAYGTV